MLYSWSVPAFSNRSPVDHVWVTDYDIRISRYSTIDEVIRHEVNYWYCWGRYHSVDEDPRRQDWLIGNKAFDLTLARCICLENVPSNLDTDAQGTIFTYGYDGVCHQLANQVLWSTAVRGSAPLTVARVRGYRLSEAVYGTYGLNIADWVSKRNGCAPQVASQSGPPRWRIIGRGGGMPGGQRDPDDEFSRHVRDVLKAKGASERADKLLTRRKELQNTLRNMREADEQAGGLTNFEALNQQQQIFFDDAAKLLGDKLFEEVFGIPPTQAVNLVDPELDQDRLDPMPPVSRGA
jgi:hypothetical protein